MRYIAALALMLALAACGRTEKLVDAVIRADLKAGTAAIECRDSSSGSCHLLFVTDVTTINAEAKQGEIANVDGLSGFVRYCVDTEAPKPAACRPRPLANGEQIVRTSVTVH